MRDFRMFKYILALNLEYFLFMAMDFLHQNFFTTQYPAATWFEVDFLYYRIHFYAKYHQISSVSI